MSGGPPCSALAESVAFHRLAQSLAANAQAAGGLGPVASGEVQVQLDELAFPVDEAGRGW